MGDGHSGEMRIRATLLGRYKILRAGITHGLLYSVHCRNVYRQNIKSSQNSYKSWGSELTKWQIMLLLLFLTKWKVNKSQAEARWRNFCFFCKHIQTERCQPPWLSLCAVGSVEQVTTAPYRLEIRLITFSLVHSKRYFGLLLSVLAMHLCFQALISNEFVCNNSVLQIRHCASAQRVFWE